MPALATDAFTRADNTDLGASWDVVTGCVRWGIGTNAVQPSAPGGGSNNAETNNSVTWPDDQYSQLTITTTTAVGNADIGVGVIIRAATGAETFYSVHGSNNNGTKMYKAVAGVYTALGTDATNLANNDVVYLEAQGTAIVSKTNGTTRISVTDSAVTTGRPGIFFSSGDTDVPVGDNWEGGNFSDGLIHFDNAAQSVFGSGVTTRTFNITVADNTDRYLRVAVGIISNSGKTVSTVARATSGADQSFTLVGSATNGDARAEIWELVAPAVGTFLVTVTATGSCDMAAGGECYYGVHQTTASEGTNTATGTTAGGSADASDSVTTTANNDWISDCITTTDNSGAATADGSGQNNRTQSGTTTGTTGSSDYGPKTPAGAKAMTWGNMSASFPWCMVAAAIRPVSATKRKWLLKRTA